MPGMINMDQNVNDDGQVILDDPFLGADPDEEVSDENIDFGDVVTDETAVLAEEAAEEVAAEDAADAAKDADADGDVDKGDRVDDTDATTDAQVEDATETADDEEGTEGEEEGTEEAATQDQRIPKKRFDEVNERRKLAEKKLAEMEAEAQAAIDAENNAFDYDAKEKEYMELVVDGEFDAANVVRKEIRAAEQAQYEQQIVETSVATREQAKVDTVFADTLADLEASYPQFSDKQNANYNQDLVDEVLDLHETFLDRGYDPSVAIQRAVNYVAKANDIAAVDEVTTEAVKPQPGEKVVPKKDILKKVVAKTTQPQNLPKSDTSEPSIDLSSMSEDEFDALPESKKKELRGDFI